MAHRIDAEHVDEHEPRVGGNGVVRAGEPECAPCGGLGVLRRVERIRGWARIGEPERAHDPAMVFGDGAAAGDLRRDAVGERRYERMVASHHDARLLLRQATPQRDLDRQRDRRETDVDVEREAAIADLAPGR